MFNDNLEWELAPRIFKKLCDVMGTPDVDLFASRINNKCEKYCSRFADPSSTWVDAFSFSWTGLNVYAFPPFSLVQRVLKKALRDKPQKLILVMPDWKTRPWHSMVRQYSRQLLHISRKRGNLRNQSREADQLLNSVPLVISRL